MSWSASSSSRKLPSPPPLLRPARAAQQAPGLTEKASYVVFLFVTGRPNRTKNAVRILEGFLQDPTKEIHGFSFIEDLGLKSGAVYPLLSRWEKMGWLESRWEETDLPGPRKRLYRLTMVGVPAAREFVEEGKAPSEDKKSVHGFPAPRTA
jgi:PadR family transcriptional regulator, regulatory protein PadR